MNTNIISRVPARYWGYLSLILWGGATLLLLNKAPYSLNEGAAKALLLVWSVADNVASSVVTLGAPDLRILLYLPAGFLWTGNVFAAKIFTILFLALAAWLFHSWKQASAEPESALIATGLLLISPLTLAQIDSLSPGIYLLLAFATGAWMDKAYRSTPRPFGGWYFAQLLACALSASLHPAGLAYPLALLWSWRKEPLNHKQQKYFYIGIGFVVLITLLIRMGWNDVEWLQNPAHSLSGIVFGPSQNNEMTVARWVAGITILLLLSGIVLKQYRALWSDLAGRTLLIALLLGATACDTAWATIALGVMLYFGTPLLLRATQSDSGGFAHQRGIALVLIIVVSTLFMRADRAYYETRQLGFLSDQDMLIKELSEAAESARKSAEENEGKTPAVRLRVASQWPGRTMIACRCDTLPLPPAAQNPQAQLSMMHSITHLLFNPQQKTNILLSRNMAVLGGDTVETIALQPGGVLLHFKDANPPPGTGK